jgi:hypothetical protein
VTVNGKGKGEVGRLCRGHGTAAQPPAAAAEDGTEGRTASTTGVATGDTGYVQSSKSSAILADFDFISASFQTGTPDMDPWLDDSTGRHCRRSHCMMGILLPSC